MYTNNFIHIYRIICLHHSMRKRIDVVYDYNARVMDVYLFILFQTKILFSVKTNLLNTHRFRCHLRRVCGMWKISEAIDG